MRLVLLVVGALIMVLSGGCSLFVAMGMLSLAAHYDGGIFDMLASLIPVLVVGGVPFFIGWVFYRAGSSMEDEESERVDKGGEE